MGTVLRIEFNVTSYADWKKIFDSDPADRAGNGVTAYSIVQASDDPNCVVVDLKFEGQPAAQAFLGKVQGVVANQGAGVVTNANPRIFNKVEYKELAPKSESAGQ